MNKRLILIPALLMAASAMVFTGCSKDDDSTAPNITLNGLEVMQIDLQEVYVEPGATANDGEDGSVNVIITGIVNNDLKGNYTITYTAADAAGNTATADRIVQVVNSADFLGGNYVNATDTCSVTAPSTFNATVIPSTTENGVINVSNFGAFGSTIIVECMYNKTTSKITANTPQALGGGANLTNVFAASAVTSTTPVIFKVYYQWQDGVTGLGEICTSTYTK